MLSNRFAVKIGDIYFSYDDQFTLVALGGHTIAQDEATSVVFGMPGVVVAEELADAVVPIGRMAHHLLNLVIGARQDRH